MSDPGGLARLGWPHVLVPAGRDRRLARTVVKSFGLVLGGSAGMLLGGSFGILVALLLTPLLGELAFALLLTLTLAATSMGAVVGTRVLEREAFDE